MTIFFQIGFNRCGTRAIHNFFGASRIPSVHYDSGSLATTMFDNLDKGRYILEGYKQFRAFSDMELLTHDRYLEAYRLYPQIMDQVPDAKFILNVRDPDRWIISRLNHPQRAPPLAQKFVYRRKTVLPSIYYEKYKACHGLSDVYDVATHMRAEWDSHIAAVQDTIQANDLLVFNIEKDSPLALCRFVGLGDSAARHYRQANRTDALAVRYLKERLPDPILKLAPKPAKRTTVKFLNSMTRLFGS